MVRDRVHILHMVKSSCTKYGPSRTEQLYPWTLSLNQYSSWPTICRESPSLLSFLATTFQERTVQDQNVIVQQVGHLLCIQTTQFYPWNPVRFPRTLQKVILEALRNESKENSSSLLNWLFSTWTIRWYNLRISFSFSARKDIIGKSQIWDAWI